MVTKICLSLTALRYQLVYLYDVQIHTPYRWLYKISYIKYQFQPIYHDSSCPTEASCCPKFPLLSLLPALLASKTTMKDNFVCLNRPPFIPTSHWYHFFLVITLLVVPFLKVLFLKVLLFLIQRILWGVSLYKVTNNTGLGMSCKLQQSLTNI